MTAFLIAAALMLATALFFILPTLLRKQSASTVHVQRDALNLEVLRDQLRELNADREAGVIDAAGYENSRRELEQRVAEDVRPGTQTIVAQTGKPWTAIGLAILVPVVAAALYFTLGKPRRPRSKQGCRRQFCGEHHTRANQRHGRKTGAPLEGYAR